MLDDVRETDLKTFIAREEISRFVDQLNAISPIPLILVDHSCNIIYKDGGVVEEKENKLDSAENDIHRFPVQVNNAHIGEIAGRGSSEIPEKQLMESLKCMGEMLNDRLAHESRIDSLSSEIVNTYQELNLLYEMSEPLSSVLDKETICDIVLKRAVDIIGSKSSVVMLLDPDGEQLTISASAGGAKDLKGTRIKVKDSIYESVVQDNAPLVIEDAEKYPHLKDKIDPDSELAALPLICVPLSVKDEVAGLISMSTKLSGKTFTTEDTKLLCAMVSQMGMSLGNARLYEDLNTAFLSTVEALAAAVEAKDPYTHGHCRRVAEYSVSIAQEMGLPVGGIADLRLAGILHDVGKIGISESILKKAGRLNKEELMEIRSHPVKGAEIIEHIENMHDIATWIRYHHERCDGTGYPDGLKGEEIPVYSRILAVADAYDALTSSRSYNPRYPFDIPLVKLKIGAGLHFDAEIVDIFLELARENAYRKYIEEYEESNDPSIQKLNRLAYYRIDNEIINLLTTEAMGDSISESEWKRLQELRKLVFR